MVRINVAALKAELSKYLDLANKGEQVIVTSHGQEIAKIGPTQAVTVAPTNWSAFFQKNRPVKPAKKGLSAAQLIRSLRDE
jgi:prevent-host-death family protein